MLNKSTSLEKKNKCATLKFKVRQGEIHRQRRNLFKPPCKRLTFIKPKLCISAYVHWYKSLSLM